MAKKYADVRVTITVEFEDDGENDLIDQALDAAQTANQDFEVTAWELVGKVRDTELSA